MTLPVPQKNFAARIPMPQKNFASWAIEPKKFPAQLGSRQNIFCLNSVRAKKIFGTPSQKRPFTSERKLSDTPRSRQKNFVSTLYEPKIFWAQLRSGQKIFWGDQKDLGNFPLGPFCIGNRHGRRTGCLREERAGKESLLGPVPGHRRPRAGTHRRPGNGPPDHRHHHGNRHVIRTRPSRLFF